MPLYDYQCMDCQTMFEVSCKISEKSNPHECPNCQSTKTESRILSAPKVGDSIALGLNQHQRGFKEVLNKIHARAAGSALNQTTEL
jgi:putative FmdB family regulatory protein